MKRFFALVAVCIMLFCTASFPVQAAESSTTITHFEDGSYLVTEIQSSTSRIFTKVGSKTDTYYSADDEIQWKMAITAEFLYDGTTCTCTYASGNTTIYNTVRWSKVSDYASYSGNSASYTTIFNAKALGIVVGTRENTVSITCDENGNIS